MAVNAKTRIGDAAFATRLRRELEGEVLFDAFTRGRYATDASIYEIEPIGVVVPRHDDDALAALEMAAESGTPILPRGAGSSQCGQAVGRALVLDTTKHLNQVLELDTDARTVWVEPGVVLDGLNRLLKPYGLWFPVDVSTSAQATLGGMTANNSCGARSIRYGNMVHNVLEIETWLSDGSRVRFGEVDRVDEPRRLRELVTFVRALFEREAEEIEARVPKVQRRVAGYNLDMASAGAFNMAQLLVGSEGTLGYFRRIKIALAELPAHKVLGVVHCPSFRAAMEATARIVALEPTAVELVDKTMIGLSRRIPAFRATVDATVVGDPAALLLVEFAGDDAAVLSRRLDDLEALMGDIGLPASVVRLEDASAQSAVWNVRKAGLNIMMSMKGDAKPVSFIEDCAVPLEHLADYTDRLNEIFARHGTEGTFYAHASVGCLHVRPVLNMRDASGARKMRAIAEEACTLVQELKGSYSGEHGDGLVRSEWIAPMYGPRLANAFAEIKRAFDPAGLMNPGKIVDAPKMDDPGLMRFRDDDAPLDVAAGLDWSDHEVGDHNFGRGFAAAVEMCNNNGHCRKFDAGAMCPSYRVTLDEQHLTRGRANSLRLALAGRLGPDALGSDALHETLKWCVSCKACRRECPTGVDMAALKIEFLHQYHKHRRRPLKDHAIAHLPRYAPWAARAAWVANLRDRVPGVATLGERWLGLAAARRWPRWRRDVFRADEANGAGGRAPDIVVFADTFNTYFEPENLRAAMTVLEAAGFAIEVARPADGGRPLCCGRTYLAAGMIDRARHEARRVVDALGGFIERGVPVVGLEPACLLGLRDEYARLLGEGPARRVGDSAFLLEEFLMREHAAGRLDLPLKPLPVQRALVHGHCHQKAHAAMESTTGALGLVPDLEVATIESSCCGMAGAFGYEADNYAVSMRMAEASLLPAVRRAGANDLIVADGTSCRQQIADGAGRGARHVARVLASAL